MIKRLLTAVVGLPIVVLVFAFGNKYLMDVLLAIVAIISMNEYMKCVAHKDIKPIKWVGYFMAALIAVLHFIPLQTLSIAAVFSIPVLLLVLFLHVIVTDMKITFADMVYTLMGILYVVPLIAFVALTYGIEGDISGKVLVWYIFCASWGTDTCAYLAGIKFGKTKFSKVSPKKSVEGCVAGVFGAIFAALVYTFAINYFMGLSISYLTIAVISAVLSVIGQVGDFAASVIKRHFEIKDYSNMFPGHGGMLDRIDSVMYIAPYAYLLLMLFV